MSDFDDSVSITRTDLDSARPSWQQEGPGLGGPKPDDQSQPVPEYKSGVTESAGGAQNDGLLPEVAIGAAAPADSPAPPAPATKMVQCVTFDGTDTHTELIEAVIIP